MGHWAWGKGEEKKRLEPRARKIGFFIPFCVRSSSASNYIRTKESSTPNQIIWGNVYFNSLVD
jgi:hypothetical protein